MINRLYVHNYRCFENLDLNFADNSSVLILGNNGAGKSSLGSVLRILQDIGKGTNRVRDLLKAGDFSNGRTEVPVRIEISVEIGGRQFDYSIAFEMPEGFKEARIREESLQVDGEKIYDRKEAQVDLVVSDSAFMVDWHLVALPIIQMRGGDNVIVKFKEWVSRLIIIAPVPSLISGEADGDSLYPDKSVSNFAAWFSGVLGRYPASWSVIEENLKCMLPDFLDFERIPLGETANKIVVRFQNKDAQLKLDLGKLSDGEKCFFICAVLLGANKYHGPLFCLWDEPDNFLSLSEVGHLILSLRQSFESSGQIFVTSHNPEAIRKFSNETTLCLARKSHLEPTTARWLSDSNFRGDLVESLIRGDIPNGSQ